MAPKFIESNMAKIPINFPAKYILATIVFQVNFSLGYYWVLTIFFKVQIKINKNKNHFCAT